MHCCDLSPIAIDIFKAQKGYTTSRCNAFVWDIISMDISLEIKAKSVDVITLVFVMSAISPEKMKTVLKNILNLLKPNSYVCFRDYATGDQAQIRFLQAKDTCKLDNNFYVRGDGTTSYFFDTPFLQSLMAGASGYRLQEIKLNRVYREIENK